MSHLNPEPQSAASTLSPSLIRTLIPVLAGLLGTWLLDKFALEIDTVTAGAILTAVISWVYYAVARFLEVFASEKWGYVLGFRKQPAYVDPANVVAGGDRGDRGAAEPGPMLIAGGVILAVIGLLVAEVAFLLWVGIVLAVVGIVLLVASRS